MRFLLSFEVLFITLPLAGINIAAIVGKVFRQNFDSLEILNIGAISSLVFLPILLTLEYEHFNILFNELPIINAFILACIGTVYAPLSMETLQFTSLLRKLQTSFFISFFSYTLLIFFIVSAFSALPDSDPYYWLLKIQSEFEINTLPALNLNRPLFSSLAYIFHNSAGIDLFAFFKFIIPFFMLLILFPSALLAQFFSKRIYQICIFFLPLSSAAFIIYSSMSIPQAIANISIIFFVFFLLYSLFSKKQFFYFFAGISIFATYFYHEMVILIFIPWLLVIVVSSYPLFKKISPAKKIFVIFAGTVFFSYALWTYSFYDFLKNWIIRIIEAAMPIHTNFSFPGSYVNIDGNTVGWGNWLGITQYYAFYFGPMVFGAIILFIFLFFLHKRKPRKSKTSWKKREIMVLGFTFFIFFFIAEILPRFFNVALLPERSLGFSGIFLIAFVPIALKHSEIKRCNWLILFLVGAAVLNMIAAIYVNNLKKYLVTETQVSSAEWIKSTLPNKKIIFTHGNGSVMSVHAQSKIIDINSPKFYSDITVFDQAVQSVLDDQLIFKNACIPKNHIYIYYAETNKNNPYINRPYFKKNEKNLKDTTVFDKYPNRFKRIYVTPDTSVIIWELIQEE